MAENKKVVEVEVNKRRPRKWEPWILPEARSLIRELEKKVSTVGWHVALHGSVLLRSKSVKDLDLILYPHTSTKIWRPFADSLKYDLGLKTLHETLESCDLQMLFTHAELSQYHKENGENRQDEKWIEVWTYGNQRVDIFIMR